MKRLSSAATGAVAQIKAPAVPAVMAAVTARRDPEANLAQVISRLQKLGCNVCVKKKLVFPTNPKTGEMSGWREQAAGTEIVLAASHDLDRAAQEIANLLAPATVDDIELWLAEVSAITARRSESVEEGAMTLVAYSTRLKQYPGDIVRQTLLEWSGKWFPTWGELKDILDVRAGPCNAIADGIARLRNPEPPRPKKDMTALWRELQLLESDCVPFDLRYASRDEQVERMAARILEIKSEIAELEQET